jgi:hypothetical protein
MTGMAVHMKAAGWATAAVGKWDAGMATPDHTPEGRGYDQSLIYFHHANDYWQYTTGSCPSASDMGDSNGVSNDGGRRSLTPQERQELNLPPLTAAAADPRSSGGSSSSRTSGCPAKFTILPETGKETRFAPFVP